MVIGSTREGLSNWEDLAPTQKGHVHSHDITPETQQTRGIDHCIPDDGVMLGQRRRQRANINTELGQYLVFAVKLLYH